MKVTKEINPEPPPFEKYKLVIEVESYDDEIAIINLPQSQWSEAQRYLHNKLLESIRF